MSSTYLLELKRKHLNSAAPELLESLKEMTALARVKWGNLDPDANALFEKAQAAIRKAKGEL